MLSRSESGWAAGGRAKWWPTSFGIFDNLSIAIEQAEIGQGLINSAIYAVTGGLGAVIVAALASFAMLIRPLPPGCCPVSTTWHRCRVIGYRGVGRQVRPAHASARPAIEQLLGEMSDVIADR